MCVCTVYIVCVSVFLISVVNEVFSEQYRGFECLHVPSSSVSARVVGRGCPEKRSKKKTEQRKLFV